MSQFINARDAIVAEAVDGLLRVSGGRLSRLDGYPDIKVVVRTDWDHRQVALVSGGGSGHEPSHAGFVGPGMLTAAVCGEVFASPSVDAVLAGILAVTGDAGCLLIVKNYTGDRLNFGLAAERARAMGRKVNMVIVKDDIALPELPQARGLAGALFVHKIAGALAEEGADLETVTTAANRVIASTVSIGMSLDTCTVPGSPKDARIPAGKAELGLGIHGEPGVEQVDYANAHGAIDAVLGKLAPFVKEQPQVLLLNNLGGASALEMSVLAHEVLRSPLGARIGHVIGPATMMTSLDMRGFSLSLLPANEADLRLLAKPIPMTAWPGLAEVVEPRLVAMPQGLHSAKVAPSPNAAARAIVITVCNALVRAEADLNALDAKVGDGDTGSTLAGGARAIAGSLDDLPLAELPALLSCIGMTLSQVMGGSSGVLLAIFFAAAGDAASRGATLRPALIAGLARMQQVGGAQLGDRTMVDALSPAIDALVNGVAVAAATARQGATSTAAMTRARSGRASYVGADRLVGNVDPGAEAVARVFEALAQ